MGAGTLSEVGPMPTLLSPPRANHWGKKKPIFVSSRTVDLTGESRVLPLCEIPTDTMKRGSSCDTLMSDFSCDTLTEPIDESARNQVFVSSHTLDLTGEGRGVPLLRI